MLQNNVKMNMDAFRKLQRMDDLAHGINASGIFALLVINMNGDNVSKISAAQLMASTKKKAQIMGFKLPAHANVRAMVDKTLTLLAKASMIKTVNLPLKSGQFCFKINPNVTQL